MFKFKKSTDNAGRRFDVDLLISNNPILYCKDNALYEGGVFSIGHNKISNEYEAYLKIPFYDQDGNVIKDCMAHYHFEPMYCILAKNIYTKEDYDNIILKRTKIDELKELLKRLEDI